MRIFFLSLIIVIAIPTIIFAQDLEYKLAAPIPGGQEKVSGENTFLQYVSYLLPFMLSIAAIAALIMFIYGGIEYAASGGSPDRASRGKEKITSALLGLLLAVGSVLILRTINPELIKLQLPLDAVGLGGYTPEKQIDCSGPCTGTCYDGKVCKPGFCVAKAGEPYHCESYTPPACTSADGCRDCLPAEFKRCVADLKLKGQEPGRCYVIQKVVICEPKQ